MNASERRAVTRTTAVGAALGVAATVVGLFLSSVIPVVSNIVLVGYGLILGAIFGALFGMALIRARADGSPEIADLQRVAAREE